MKFCLAICLALIARIAIALPLEQEESSVEHEETHVEHVEEGCKAVDYDIADVDFNHFVTNQMRADVCRSNFHFNMSGRVQIKHLGEEYNYISHENPCIVMCQLDMTRAPGTPYTRTEYAALEQLTLHMAENTVCGPDNHRCDAHGCCVKVVEQPEEHHEEHPVEEHPVEEHPVEEHPVEEHPKEEHPEEEHPVEEHPVEHPVEEHPAEEHPVEEHPVEEHPKEEHPVEEEHPKKEEVPEKQYACTEAGVFVDPEDETSFFRCYLKSAHLKCADGLFFHAESHKCEEHTVEEHPVEEHPVEEHPVEEHPVEEHPAEDHEVHDPAGQPEVQAPEYDNFLQCHEEGYFRNPFDCNLFYRCYKTSAESELRLALFECTGGQVFDEVSKNCVPAERTAECVNHELPRGVELHYRS